MMNATHALKLLIIALTLCTVTGCKLLLIVPLGGSVQFSEALDCHPDSFAPPLYNSWSHGRLCEIDITDSMFSASFTAQPDAGYEFVGWRDGKDFQCGGSKKDTCTIALNGSAVANVIVASQNTGFLMPVFKDVGIDTDKDGTPDRKDNDDDNDGVDDDNDTCPTIAGPSIAGCPVITDTISRVGKIWAQADLFEGFSWNDMNRACPGGVCGQGALLGDFDMSGWRWASGAEVQVLMNSYAPNDLPAEVTPPYSNFETGDFWAMNAFDGGWRPTLFDFQPDASPSQATQGLVSDPIDAHTGRPTYIRIDCRNCFSTIASWYTYAQPLGYTAGQKTSRMGAYFYRLDDT